MDIKYFELFLAKFDTMTDLFGGEVIIDNFFQWTSTRSKSKMINFYCEIAPDSGFFFSETRNGFFFQVGNIL